MKKQEETVNKSSSSRPMTEDQKRSEEKFWQEREVRANYIPYGRRQRKSIFEEGSKGFIDKLERKREISLRRRKPRRKRNPEVHQEGQKSKKGEVTYTKAKDDLS